MNAKDIQLYCRGLQLHHLPGPESLPGPEPTGFRAHHHTPRCATTLSPPGVPIAASSGSEGEPDGGAPAYVP